MKTQTLTKGLAIAALTLGTLAAKAASLTCVISAEGQTPGTYDQPVMQMTWDTSVEKSKVFRFENGIFYSGNISEEGSITLLIGTPSTYDVAVSKTQDFVMLLSSARKRTLSCFDAAKLSK